MTTGQRELGRGDVERCVVCAADGRPEPALGPDGEVAISAHPFGILAGVLASRFGGNLAPVAVRRLLCLRARRHGAEVVYVPAACAYHAGGGSTPDRTGPWPHLYRGLLLFFERHRRRQLPAARAAVLLRALVGTAAGVARLAQTPARGAARIRAWSQIARTQTTRQATTRQATTRQATAPQATEPQATAAQTTTAHRQSQPHPAGPEDRTAMTS